MDWHRPIRLLNFTVMGKSMYCKMPYLCQLINYIHLNSQVAVKLYQNGMCPTTAKSCKVMPCWSRLSAGKAKASWKAVMPMHYVNVWCILNGLTFPIGLRCCLVQHLKPAL